MYQGIKRKTLGIKREIKKMPTKMQILQLEENASNGLITQSYKLVTHDFIADPNINYKDFEITNLKAAGIDPETLPTTILSTNVETLATNAEKAINEIDKFEIIAEMERESNE